MSIRFELFILYFCFSWSCFEFKCFMCMIFLFENYELRIWICRRTTGPIRRAKGGWTPEEVSAFLDLFNSYARRSCCLFVCWLIGGWGLVQVSGWVTSKPGPAWCFTSFQCYFYPLINDSMIITMIMSIHNIARSLLVFSCQLSAVASLLLWSIVLKSNCYWQPF